MKRIVYISIFSLGIILLGACQDVIDLKIDSAASQIVFEGNITDQQAVQVIKISKSVSYTDQNIYPAVTGATIVVTDSKGNTIPFTEKDPGTYVSASFKGEPGVTYTMNAKAGSISYTAVSTMPKPVLIDSLSLKPVNFGSSDTRFPQVHYKDPIGDDNYYRFVMYINGILTKNIFAENDRLTNGKAVTTPLFYDTDNQNKKLEKGDKVDVEMQCIDKNIFTYWFTMQQQGQNGPGGGVAPGNPPSNVNNNALGYFSAHTTNSMSLMVK